MSTEIPRLLEPHLRELLSGLSALSIEGARGVGKTWLARRLGTTFVPVDDPDERAQLLRLGNRFPQMITPPVVLDEWQLLPELWDRVRRQVDEDPSPGRFILTGAGWGHGVGLCQIGAAVMGEQGYKYDAILLHYYIGASIDKLYE